MKNSLPYLALIAISLGSCISGKYATNGSSYESDDVYYQSGDQYISDFGYADTYADTHTYGPSDSGDEKETQQSQSQAPSDDDYYSGDTGQNTYGNGTTNNYYGNVYQNQSPWYNTYGGYGSGYSSYAYGSYWNNYGPNYGLGWNPYSGWYMSFNYGYGNYYNMCSPYCYNSWNSWGYGYPYYGYSPYYGYGGYGYGYNSPFYGSYPYYNNGLYNGGYYGSNDGSGSAGVIYGPRHPISVGSSVNSAYSGSVFYADRSAKPGIEIRPIGGKDTGRVAGGQDAERPSSNYTYETIRSEGKRVDNNGARPAGTFSQPSDNGRTDDYYARPSGGRTNTSVPNNVNPQPAQPDRREPSIDRGRSNSGNDRPAPSFESNPGRSNGGGSAPSNGGGGGGRSGGGGGSTSGGRRK